MLKKHVFWFLCWCLLSPTRGKNTLLIISDDAGLELGCYGNRVVKTPNIDKLARMGTVFHNAFTSVSSCSPSRSAILTGLPIHQNGMNGLHQDIHHFNSYQEVRSLPKIIKRSKGGRNFMSGIIGKKHVGPSSVFEFDIEHTEEKESILQVGRNITRIRMLARRFLKKAQKNSKDFLLYVAFHDTHRCGHTNPEYGNFCENFGNGQPGMGSIKDWKPEYYEPSQVVVPYFVQDTPAARQDIANQYTAISRLDQGVGLLMEELRNWNLENETLVIFSSDNGIPFPSGRTNFYDPGIREPLIVYAPKQLKGEEKVDSVYTQASLLDLVPTILDWHNVSLPSYTILKKAVSYTGRSLLQALPKHRLVFGSHNFHEVSMAYPMRYVRSRRYKLIHNLAFGASFPIDQDFYLSPTFQDILQRTRQNESLKWYKDSLADYYKRPEYELFDLKVDSEELHNVADKPLYRDIFDELLLELKQWQGETKDPWICSPHGVLEDKGLFKDKPQCMPLMN